MKNKYPFLFAIVYGILLCGATAFVLLKVFVIEDREIENVQNGGIYAETTNMDSTEQEEETDESQAEVNDNSYKDDNIQITITQKRVNDTDVYIADIIVSDITYLKTAFADKAYGRNVKQTTSDMAEDNNAILAINGDYYGFRDYGYVLRNGVLYRENIGNSSDESFVIYDSGDCETIVQGDVSADTLYENGAVQILSFRPGLISEGSLMVDENDEVKQSSNSNPRTAIGMVEPLHYVMVVSDGRTSKSAGLSLYELANVLKDAGCTEAYNLDGGGSTTMWFNGKVINNPIGGYSAGSERRVSDIVYIG